jgi:hypothetical protein
VVDPLERIRRTLWALYEFLNANPVFVELILLGDAGPRMKAGHQRFACFHEVAAGVTALHRTATKCTMTTKTKTQVSKRQFISALATIPSTIGMCHLAVYLKLGTPAEGWASLTGFFVALPGWMVLARRYRRR